MVNMVVDIIVPVYNVSKYLNKCIESLLAQTYKYIKIILVDDGSTDGSEKICDNYARIDDRINVIHKENGGLVSAWTMGIKNSKSEWVVFVDGDDWVEYKHSFIIFIKQGGGVLIITIVTGLSNRLFIQSNDLDRFDSYSTIVSRINYSIICSFSAFICFIESYSINLKRMDNPFFSQGIMWITVLIGTWISFEGLSEPRKNETEKINKDKNILPKDIIEYAISLFVGPITLIIVIVISYFWKLNIKQLPKCIYIIAFSFAINVIIMGLIINKIRNRSSESYKTRIYKKIITLKEGEKMNIFYSNLYLNIEKEGQKIKLKILEQNIEIDKKNEISKKGRKQLEEWFSMPYVFTYDLSRQGYNEMIQKLDEHSNNRKDALNKCYNQIRTNYFKKHKNCYCS